MTTGRKLITRALNKAGVTFKSETPDADEMEDGLDALNDMVEAWANDGTLVYARTTENFTLTANDGTYTIGSGGDFDTTRPVKIVRAWTRSGDVDYGMNIVDDKAYAQIVQKSVSSNIPRVLNCDYAYPLATIKLYPVPSEGTEIYILSEKELSAFTLDGTVNLPPGWRRAIIHNLAVEMAGEYGQEPPSSVSRIAIDSLASIRRGIMRQRGIDVPRRAGAKRNVFTGWE